MGKCLKEVLPHKKKNLLEFQSFKSVKRSVYESNDRDRKDKWDTLIRKCEAKANNLVQKDTPGVFPISLKPNLKESAKENIENAVNIDIVQNKCEIGTTQDSGTRLSSILKKTSSQIKKPTRSLQFKSDSGMILDESRGFVKTEVEDEIHPWDLIVHPEINDVSDKRNAQKQKMYLKFLYEPEEKVSVLRSKNVNVELNEIQFHKNIHMRERHISNDFLSWFNLLGGFQTKLTTTSLTDQFHFHLVNPASKVICSKIKECSTLPEKVIAANNMTKKSQSYVLRRHQLWNIYAENKKKEVVAFYKHLPCSRRHQPPRNKTISEWFNTDQVSFDKLEMFPAILHLQSTIGLCKWLKKNKKPLPGYLKNVKMSKFLNEKKFSKNELSEKK